jgi:tRNA modification GTPase
MTTPDARAAVITPPGEGGIGIIALAGRDAVNVLDSVFDGTKRPAGALEPGAVAHGTVRRDGAILDEVIVARVEEPGGPAAGACFEVNCHGGVVAVRSVLRCLEEAGARVVGPSEFAPRPLSGAGPLSRAALRARALASLPRARTRLGAAMLLRQAAGALSDELEGVSELLRAGEAHEAAARLDALLPAADLAQALLGPPRVALLGPPNVGKSTLLNALLEHERVIVHHEPGTTRDVVAETVSIRGVPFELMDSAGIRAALDEVERAAVERAAALAESCDVALVLFDAREGAGSAADLAGRNRPRARRILVGNKTDLLAGPPADPDAGEVVMISAKTGANLGELEAALLRPYEAAMQSVAEGAAAPFDPECVQALAAVTEALERRGSLKALEVLGRLTA